MTEPDTQDRTAMRVGIIGPTRVGKTTLINSLLRSGEGLLARTAVRMRWADGATEKMIQAQRKELEGWRVSRQFSPGALRGTAEPFTFRLKLEAGVPGLELLFELLDYPGAWLDPSLRTNREADWEQCRTFIEDSSVLLMPVDAVVLMETVGQSERKYVPSILTTPEVEDVVRDWARARHANPDEPALVIVVPVRTESYFADNGGVRDRALDLYAQVKEVYGAVFDAIREEAPGAVIRYAPVDTVGCVEFMSAQWAPQLNGDAPVFMAQYRVRRRPDGGAPEIRMAGINDVFVLLVQHLLSLSQRARAQEAGAARARADAAAELAVRNEGFWGNTLLWLTGEKAARRSRAQITRQMADLADSSANALAEQLHRLAGLGLGARARDL
ncbi:GTPase [Cryptosporangium aurantiacum]|uniref:50S ribosome-binding GTPase n=1 Tax=Cryptosporangium aurantiacum TaxID=134849 RepID=A0A1M7I9G9_9ACTN|nr:GTPase [Cryptosporangium aurantiacum]SHM37248.1 50S ribosome-binding GTPase [Cryptosporangium aurantiacum]